MLKDIPFYELENQVKKRAFVNFNSVKKTAAINNLQNAFDHLINYDSRFASFISELSATTSRAVVFGGWVRDNIISYQKGIQFQPRDIDIVVEGSSCIDLGKMLPPNRNINIFDGLSAKMSTIYLDTWLLGNTYLITRQNLLSRFKTLPYTTVFRINSIIFYPKQFWDKPELNEIGCIEAISKGIIDFQSSHIPFPRIQVARAVIYAVKLQYKLDNEILLFIKKICDDPKSFPEVIGGIDTYCPEKYRRKAKELFFSIIHK